jgi:hypothetical protein
MAGDHLRKDKETSRELRVLFIFVVAVTFCSSVFV